MKIIHFIDYFQPKIGYQEYFLAREQQKLGHKVTVVTSDKYFPFPNYNETYFKILGKRYVGAGERIEEEVKVKRLKSIEIVPGSLVLLLGLSAALKEISPDIVFCHNVYSITSFLASWYKKETGYKLIYDTHAAFFNTNLTDTFMKKIYYLLYHTIAVSSIKRKADKIFAIGEEEQNFICNDFFLDKKEVPIIHLGADVKLFSFSEKARQSMRGKLNIKESDILVIYAGKVTPNKDLHILSRAINLLDNEAIKILFIGGGNGKYMLEIKKDLNKNQFIWRSLVENKELPFYFSAADIGIWPGDPSAVMLEAMACRIPLILPKWKETEYLDQSGGVVRFSRGNVAELKNRINEIAKDKQTREKLAVNAENYVKNKLSWTKIAQKCMNLVKNPHFYSIS